MSTNTKEAKSSKAKADTQLPEDQRQRGIEVAAYHIAEKCGFKEGCDLKIGWPQKRKSISCWPRGSSSRN